MQKIKEELITPHNFDETTKDSYIILDTNILLNIAYSNKSYLELLSKLKGNNADLITFDVCFYEFLKGSNSNQEIKIKTEIFKRFDIEIITSKNLLEDYLKIIKVYRLKGRNVSFVDLFLASALAKYSINNQKIFILTGNYKDFYFNIFLRECIVIINSQDQIIPLVFLKLNKEAFKKSIDSFK